jgi:hypothetical protein
MIGKAVSIKFANCTVVNTGPAGWDERRHETRGPG